MQFSFFVFDASFLCLNEKFPPPPPPPLLSVAPLGDVFGANKKFWQNMQEGLQQRKKVSLVPIQLTTSWILLSARKTRLRWDKHHPVPYYSKGTPRRGSSRTVRQ